MLIRSLPSFPKRRVPMLWEWPSEPMQSVPEGEVDGRGLDDLAEQHDFGIGHGHVAVAGIGGDAGQPRVLGTGALGAPFSS